jgi:hypothetical protein
MSFAENNTTAPNLREEFLYHASESKFHLEQYLKAFDEVEHHYKRYKEHAMYRDEFHDKLWEQRHA